MERFTFLLFSKHLSHNRLKIEVLMYFIFFVKLICVLRNIILSYIDKDKKASYIYTEVVGSTRKTR